MTATSSESRHDTQPSASSAYPTGTSRVHRPAAISMPTASGEPTYYSGFSSSSTSSIDSPPRQATLNPPPTYRAPEPNYGYPLLHTPLLRAPRPGELGWIGPEDRSQPPNPSQQPLPSAYTTQASHGSNGEDEAESDDFREVVPKRSNKKKTSEMSPMELAQNRAYRRITSRDYRAGMSDQARAQKEAQDRAIHSASYSKLTEADIELRRQKARDKMANEDSDQGKERKRKRREADGLRRKKDKDSKKK